MTNECSKKRIDKNVCLSYTIICCKEKLTKTKDPSKHTNGVAAPLLR